MVVINARKGNEYSRTLCICSTLDLFSMHHSIMKINFRSGRPDRDVVIMYAQNTVNIVHIQLML
jgi:hypothetical protein